MHGCDKCDKKFKTMEDLNEHKQHHVPTFKKKMEVPLSECKQCDKKFKTQEDLNVHAESHVKNNPKVEFPCDKCGRIYSNMSKLRRHDWRSHREIECNICGDILESRQDIGIHRKIEHQMLRKITCKFFPDCIDEDECFFEHKDINDQTEINENYQQNDFCPNGESCEDQSCQYSVWKHKKSVFCKFQATCNRLHCNFKHNIERKAFLGVGPLNNRRK